MKRKNPTARQSTVIAALLSGQTITHASEQAGIDRETVYRWLRGDHAFQAALNRGRRDAEKVGRRRLEVLVVNAIDCVGQAIADGDARVAMALLNGLGLLRPARIGSEDPAELAADAAEGGTIAELYADPPAVPLKALAGP